MRDRSKPRRSKRNLGEIWANAVPCITLSAALIVAAAASAPPAGARAETPVPAAKEFARAPAISDVSISRDGKHIVALTSADGDQATISVWRTDAPEQKPTIIGSTHMRFLKVAFLKDDRLLVTAIQTLTIGTMRGHLSKQYITDLRGEKWSTLLPESGGSNSDQDYYDSLTSASIISELPLDKENVLVEDNRAAGRGDIYRVNVYTGRAERVDHGSSKFGDVQADLKGEVRARVEVGFQDGKAYFAQWIKNPATGAWEEHFRSYAKDRTAPSVAAFTKDPNIIYIVARQNGDKSGFYEYDIAQRKILEPVFAHKLFDVGYSFAPPTVRQSDDGDLQGFSYLADKPRDYWLDDKLKSLADGVKKALGVKTGQVAWTDPATGDKTRLTLSEGADATLESWSKDLRYAIVEKSGPQFPAEYYLLSDQGKLTLLGRARPWLRPESLGHTRLVQYAARDGLMIPAFLTTPPEARYGAGPHPAIILPHGGPWARDVMDWDPSGWPQYLAAHGYVVLQPEFRGSQGWGEKLWRAGDREWGGKMQDDNDDGARWLVDQKLADPKRMALFGYSYGGYAALVAAIRPNGLYQCSISGAGGSIASFKRGTSENRILRELQRPSVDGLDAIQQAGEVKIPVFLYHGDRDRTVDIKDSRAFVDRLKTAGKPYKYLEIKDMGHPYVTWTPAMAEQQLTEIDGFLRNDCRPGGL